MSETREKSVPPEIDAEAGIPTNPLPPAGEQPPVSIRDQLAQRIQQAGEVPIIKLPIESSSIGAGQIEITPERQQDAPDASNSPKDAETDKTPDSIEETPQTTETASTEDETAYCEEVPQSQPPVSYRPFTDRPPRREDMVDFAKFLRGFKKAKPEKPQKP